MIKSHIENTTILSLWKSVAKEAERGSNNLKQCVIHHDFFQYYVSNYNFWWWLLTPFSMSPAQTQTPLSHFLPPVSVKPASPQNLFQILQIKFLCLQCLSSFLQYIHISDLPLNTIIVHLASNYSNRKTGNHCHSDWKINAARYFYSFCGVAPSLDAHTLESQGKFQITLGFFVFFFFFNLSIYYWVSRQKYSEWHPRPSTTWFILWFCELLVLFFQQIHFLLHFTWHRTFDNPFLCSSSKFGCLWAEKEILWSFS